MSCFDSRGCRSRDETLGGKVRCEGDVESPQPGLLAGTHALDALVQGTCKERVLCTSAVAEWEGFAPAWYLHFLESFLFSVKAAAEY